MASTGSNSHNHPVKVAGKTYTTGSIGHQHTDPDHPADVLTAAEVTALRALLAAAGGGGGTIPDPNPPQVPPPDITAPTISGVQITGITTTGATVAWTTNEAATGFVEYGTTTQYGSQTSATSSGTSHSRNLPGLLPGQLYHIRIRATDTAGNVRVDSDRTFTTSQTSPIPSPSRPFALPVTTATVNVTAGANVQSVVNAASDGTKFVFAAGVTFTMTDGIYLSNRHNLIFDLNGATIKTTSQDGDTASSPFKLDPGNTHISILNGTLQGSNPNTGTNIFTSGVEFQMGVAIFDGQQIEVGNCRIRNVYGDFIYCAGKNSAPQRPSEDVWVHDCQMDYCGRMGIVPINVRDFICERNTLDHIGLICLDVECDAAYEIVDGMYFRDNTIGTYSMSGHQTNWFFACAQALGSAPGNDADIGDLRVERNVVTGGALVNGNNPAGKGGLASIVDKEHRVQGLIFKDNSTTKTGTGPVLQFSHIDTLTVTGNTQPLSSGSLGAYSDNTSAVTSPNP